MSMVDYIILGLVIDEPSSAYEITKAIELRNMSRWVKISNPAVYKNMPKLQEKGYLQGEVVKEGDMPEKTIYHITDNGREHFELLMDKLSDKFDSMNLSFVPIVMNLDKVEQEKANEMLERMKGSISRELAVLRNHRAHLPPLPPTANKIIDMYDDLYSYLDNWFGEFNDLYNVEMDRRR